VQFSITAASLRAADKQNVCIEYFVLVVSISVTHQSIARLVNY